MCPAHPAIDRAEKEIKGYNDYLDHLEDPSLEHLTKVRISVQARIDVLDKVIREMYRDNNPERDDAVKMLKRFQAVKNKITNRMDGFYPKAPKSQPKSPPQKKQFILPKEFEGSEQDNRKLGRDVIKNSKYCREITILMNRFKEIVHKNLIVDKFDINTRRSIHNMASRLNADIKSMKARATGDRKIQTVLETLQKRTQNFLRPQEKTSQLKKKQG